MSIHQPENVGDIAHRELAVEAGLQGLFRIALGFASAMMGYTMFALFGLIFLALSIIGLVVWLWTFITAFQGKEVEIPIVAGLTRSLFASQLGGA